MTSTFSAHINQWTKSESSSTFKKQQEISNSLYWRPSRKNYLMSSKNAFKKYLKKKSHMLAFRSFLQKEFSEENLDFWLEIELYKKNKRNNQAEMAQRIFDKYIATNSSKELNLDSSVKRITAENLNHPDASTFDVAQERIFTLMEKDSFRRYVSQNSKNLSEKSLLSSVSILKMLSQKVSESTLPSVKSDSFQSKSVHNAHKNCDHNTFLS